MIFYLDQSRHFIYSFRILLSVFQYLGGNSRQRKIPPEYYAIADRGTGSIADHTSKDTILGSKVLEFRTYEMLLR